MTQIGVPDDWGQTPPAYLDHLANRIQKLLEEVDGMRVGGRRPWRFLPKKSSFGSVYLAGNDIYPKPRKLNRAHHAHMILKDKDRLEAVEVELLGVMESVAGSMIPGAVNAYVPMRDLLDCVREAMKRY